MALVIAGAAALAVAAPGGARNVHDDGQHPAQPVRGCRDKTLVPDAVNGWLGENLGWDFGVQATPLSTVRRSMRSPQHRVHVLEPRYRDIDIDIGVGIGSPLPSGGPGATYSAVFGGRARAR